MRQTQQFEEPEQTPVHLEQRSPVSIASQQNVEAAEVVSVNLEQHLHLGSVAKRDLRRRALVITILPIVPFAILGAIEASMSQDAWIRLCTNPLFVVSAIAACVAVPLWSLKPSKRARRATDALAQMDDLAAIGSMIETISYTDDPRTEAQVKETLIRLLPQIRASDAHLISRRQMGMLQSMLKTPSFTRGDLLQNPFKKRAEHARLQLAILEAFEQIGDEAVLSGVLHARDHGANREVKQAAAECLPYVQQRVELVRANKTLLRASSSGAADTTVLVRPVDSAQHAPAADEMLRPASRTIDLT